jgi:predicted DNA-binding transcriptional regulator AlpA
MDGSPTPPRDRLSPACSETLLLQRPWTRQEVCEFLACSENTLDALIREAGFPPAVKLTGKGLHRWSARAVVGWWDEQQSAGPAPTPAPAAAARGGAVHRTGAGKKLGVATRR